MSCKITDLKYYRIDVLAIVVIYLDRDQVKELDNGKSK